MTDPTSDDVLVPDEEASRDRREHGGAPARLDDDALAARAEHERAEVGIADFAPDEVPPATDTEPQSDVTDSDEYREELAEVRRQVREGELVSGREAELPPTRYDEP